MIARYLLSKAVKDTYDRDNIDNLNIFRSDAVFEKDNNASGIGFKAVEDTSTLPFFLSRVVSSGPVLVSRRIKISAEFCTYS